MPRIPMSDESLRMIEHAMNVAVDEMVPYGVWSDVAGVDVQTSVGRSKLNTMRRFMQREHQVVFAVLYNVGLRRIVNGEQVKIAEHDMYKTDRSLRRTGRMLETTREKELTRESRVDFLAIRTRYEILAHFTNPRRYLKDKKNLVIAKVKDPNDAAQSMLNSTIAHFASGRLRQPRKA